LKKTTAKARGPARASASRPPLAVIMPLYSHKTYYGTFHAKSREMGLSAQSRDLDLHAVVGRLDVRRQLGLQTRVIEVGVQIGEDGAGRPDAFDPA
jgi:hypothetical protein